MFVPRSSRPVFSLTLFACGIAVALVMPSRAETEITIASVAPQYTPIAGSEMPEPVSMQRYAFQVERQTGRASVLVDYTYPNQPNFGLEGGPGPQPTRAQLPGLKYLADSNTVVYDAGGKKTVCATVRDRKRLFRNSLTVTPTGACTVTSRLDNRLVNNGWGIQRVSQLDTIFKVH